ncbi:50S ribosomal protein L11 [Candidatus Woesearchaeota archaeon]|nr:50S ribosomal protein L11 [Candidatus Woesearchaeota archaeon]
MAKEKIDVLIEGGKATAAPPLGPALGPLGVNIGQVVAEINNKTADFKGMKVPVKVTVDKDTKEFEIAVGTPPASQLIKKEAGIQKGASNPKTDKIADLAMEQVIKIAKMKSDALLGADNIAKVKEILGTCQSMGILVEGKRPSEIFEEMKSGKYSEMIISGKTELSAEEIKELEEEKKKLQEEMEEKRAEFEAKAKSIISEMKNKKRTEIAKKLDEAGIPNVIYEPLLPAEEKEPDDGANKKPEPAKKA